MLTEKILEEARRISKKRQEASKVSEQELLLKVLELFDLWGVREVYIGENVEGTLVCRISYTKVTCFLGIDELVETPWLRKAVQEIELLHMYDFEKMKSYVSSIARELDELGFKVKSHPFSNAISITLQS